MGQCGIEFEDQMIKKYQRVDFSTLYKTEKVIKQSSYSAAMSATARYENTPITLKSIITNNKKNPKADTKKRTVNLFEKLKNAPHANICTVEKISTFADGNTVTVAEESMEKWFSLS